MSTWLDLITDAAIGIGFGLEQPLSAADGQFCLRHAQRMMDTWSNQNCAVYDLYFDTLTLVPGTQSYSSTLLANGRPVSVDSCYFTLSGVSYECDIIGTQDWEAIGYKGTTGLPDRCWPDISYPTDTFYFYPIPSAAYVANFALRRQIAAAITLATTVSFPPGYENAIVSCLTKKLATAYRRPLTPDQEQESRDALAWIKRTNTEPLQMQTNLPIRRRLYNVQRGY